VGAPGIDNAISALASRFASIAPPSLGKGCKLERSTSMCGDRLQNGILALTLLCTSSPAH
jgi:hypothetical protein